MTEPEESSAERASRLHSNLVLEELVAANHESNQTMVALVEKVREETAARDRKVEVLEANNKQTHLLLFMVGGAVVVLVLMAIFNAIGITSARQTTETTARIAKNVDATNQTLLDCLNSQGQCGKVNAAQQEDILDEVKKYNLVGFYCIRTNSATKDPKGELFLKCMARLYPGGPTLTDR